VVAMEHFLFQSHKLLDHFEPARIALSRMKNQAFFSMLSGSAKEWIVFYQSSSLLRRLPMEERAKSFLIDRSF